MTKSKNRRYHNRHVTTQSKLKLWYNDVNLKSFLEEIELPENSIVLVTLLDQLPLEDLTLGEHLVAGLQDILLKRTTEINTPQELAHHLDTLFDEP